MDEITLTVPRRELAAAVAYVKKAVQRSKLAKSEMVLDFTQDSLVLNLGTVNARLPAVCSGVGRVFVSGLTLEVLAMALISIDTVDVLIRIDETMLRLGRNGVSCRWTRTEHQPASILLPLNANLLDVLELRYRYSQAEIIAAALEKRLIEAEDRKARLIAKASQALEPLNVSAADLNNLVTERIKEYVKRYDT